MLTDSTYAGSVIPPITPIRPFLIREVQECVSRVTGVLPADLLSSSRSPCNAGPRQVGMWTARRLAQRSYPDIARHFKRDHTTALHGTRVVSNLILKDDETWHTVRAVLVELNGAAPEFQLELCFIRETWRAPERKIACHDRPEVQPELPIRRGMARKNMRHFQLVLPFTWKCANVPEFQLEFLMDLRVPEPELPFA